jgi:hypothetical protein
VEQIFYLQLIISFDIMINYLLFNITTVFIFASGSVLLMPCATYIVLLTLDFNIIMIIYLNIIYCCINGVFSACKEVFYKNLYFQCALLFSFL